MRPAFFNVAYAPFLRMVLIASVERVKVIDFWSSGMKIFFFWKFGYLRTIPVGLNWVARVRFEYPPDIFEPLLVTGQTFAMSLGFVSYRAMVAYTV
jgi:hypothetical protein